MDAIVDAKDFGLAAWFLPDPEARVRELGTRLNEDVRMLRAPDRATRHLDRKLEADARVYADEVGLIIRVQNGVGQLEEAALLRDFAVAFVEDASVRDSVRELLLRNAGRR
jgi:hypothetical protein